MSFSRNVIHGLPVFLSFFLASLIVLGTLCYHFYVAGSLQIIRMSTPILFKSVLVAAAAGHFISLAYVGNGWTTIVLLV
jgi:hypothetical protein